MTEEELQEHAQLVGELLQEGQSKGLVRDMARGMDRLLGEIKALRVAIHLLERGKYGVMDYAAKCMDLEERNRKLTVEVETLRLKVEAFERAELR